MQTIESFDETEQEVNNESQARSPSRMNVKPKDRGRQVRQWLENKKVGGVHS